MLLGQFTEWLWTRPQFSRRMGKRTQRFNCELSHPEDLETRQLLSTLHHSEKNMNVTEVCTIVTNDADSRPQRPGQHKEVVSRIAPTYPNIAGSWNLEAAADIDDDPTLNFSGTVLLDQKGRRVAGHVELEGLPAFRIKGKLDRQDTSQLKGSTRFPVEVSDDRYYFLRGHLTVSFAPDVATFTGQVHRVIFGHHIDIALSAEKP